MLKECRTHGYFRSEECPICGEQGRFLMNEEELDKLGRTMAGVLRHFPERYGLRMNKHGWVDLEEFINEVRHKQRRFRWLKPHHILAIIDTDPKGRYQFRDGMIRATYAHSVDVELDLPTRGVPDFLYYPTTKEEKDILLETGLMPSDRKMVHLGKTVESAMVAVPFIARQTTKWKPVFGLAVISCSVPCSTESVPVTVPYELSRTVHRYRFTANVPSTVASPLVSVTLVAAAAGSAIATVPLVTSQPAK